MDSLLQIDEGHASISNSLAQIPPSDLHKEQSREEDQEREMTKKGERSKTPHTWEQLGMGWHSLGHVVNQVKAERGISKFADVGTQFPLVRLVWVRFGHGESHASCRIDSSYFVAGR